MPEKIWLVALHVVSSAARFLVSAVSGNDADRLGHLNAGALAKAAADAFVSDVWLLHEPDRDGDIG